jgi:TonB family protein
MTVLAAAAFSATLFIVFASPGCPAQKADKITGEADKVDEGSSSIEIRSPADSELDFVAFDTPPSPTKTVTPVYPEIDRRRKIQGTAYIEVTVDAAGAVADARVLHSRTAHSLTDLEEAVVKAFARWEFEPMRLDGEPVESTVNVPVRVSRDSSQPGCAMYTVKESAVGSWPRGGEDVRGKEQTPSQATRKIFPQDLPCESVRNLVVLLEAKVSEGGEVSDAWVPQPIMMAGLGRAAVTAAKQWEFTPALQGDTPVNSKIVIPFEFKLD